MKTTIKTWTFTTAMILSFSMMAQDVTVESIDNGARELENIESYSFVEEFDNNWFTTNELEGSMIRESLVYEFDTRDLKLDREDPDVLLNFHIYDQKYTSEDYVGDAPYEYTYTKKQDIINSIEDGTVILSVIDKESGESLWEGFANVDYKDDYSLREKQIGIRKAADALVGRFMAETVDS